MDDNIDMMQFLVEGSAGSNALTRLWVRHANTRAKATKKRGVVNHGNAEKLPKKMHDLCEHSQQGI